MPRLSPEAHVQSLLDSNRRDPGVREELTPQEINSVAVVGAGLMGAAIAAAHANRGLPVVVFDPDPAARAAAPERIAAELAAADDSPERDAHDAVRSRVTVADNLSRAAACDLVIESIPETPTLKQELYGRLAPDLRSESVLTSNTSTIPIARLAASLASPDRFCGLHFFHPVRKRRLVEVIRGPKTAAATVATIVAHVKRIGKLPLVVEDGPGFLVNRLLLPYLTEAMELVREGAAIEAVERAAIEFGMAMGPLRLLDEIGLDTVLRGGHVLWEAFPGRVVPSPLLVAMIKAKRLGRKAGAGFFRYPPDLGLESPGAIDPAVPPILAPWLRADRVPAAATIAPRLFLPMLLEATRILEEGKARGPADVDLAVLFGLGFPASRGGLLYWADTLGPAAVLDALRPLESLGERAQPTAMLRSMAERNGRFFAAG
jgi:3-hydroxyacyl-CoA dehydrogenase/enoyl-CoA hydratase/3-hydroxybutyryl-CoA epimerase/3-hydroxyacyl-CoA dehydrogenase/enoyl-CoA hydratase/3-hydroxybutyryl-CoA epimerase/enoyl-CoA isomerase